MPAGKKQWAQSWGLAVTELKTREGTEKRRAFTELWGISRACIVEENSPGMRGEGEAGGAAWIVAVWMLQVTSRKGSQDQCLRPANREEKKLGKMLQGDQLAAGSTGKRERNPWKQQNRGSHLAGQGKKGPDEKLQLLPLLS